MQNQNILYRPRFPQYDSGIYGRYNNYNIPLKYTSKQIKKCNYCFSSEEENINPNAFYILTDKINQTKNQNSLNKLNIKDTNLFSNSQNQYKGYNHHKDAFKSLEKNNNQYSVPRKNNPRPTNSNYISFNSVIEGKDFNSNDADNICYNLFNKEIKKKPNNSILKKKYSSIAMIGYGQNNINGNTLYYHTNNNSYSCYNQPFTKQSHSLFNKEYLKISNNLNKDYDNKNGFEEKQMFVNNNNFSGEAQKKVNGLNKNKTINNIYNNNASNINKVTKKNKNGNTIASNKIEKKNKPHIYNNISFSKIENLDMENNFIENQYQMENKKKINLVINTSNTIEERKKIENIPSIPSNRPKEIKKLNEISLIGLTNSKYIIDNKNNHSFYEIKSLSKHLSQKNIHSNPLNNNQIKNIVCKKKKNNEKKIIKEKLIKNKSNLKLLDDNSIKEKNELKAKKINLTELNECIKKDGNSYIIRNGAQRRALETSFINEISNYEPKSKENINYLNINDINPNNDYNNNFVIEDKVKRKNIIIKIDKIRHKNSTKNVIPKGKKILNTIVNNKENLSISKNSNQKLNDRGLSVSSIYIVTPKSVETKKICSNYFSFYSKTKNKSKIKKKKNKDFHNKKNMIQLLNINNKTYEEDFPLKYESDINIKNQSLKPQISFRLTLFGSKEPEYEKYFVVNTFCSENIREKPDQSESDF